MGMYDVVKVPCPKCKKEEEFQSKSGDCILAVYTLENVPADVVLDINRHAPYTCTDCGTEFGVKTEFTVKCESVPFSELVIEDDGW